MAKKIKIAIAVVIIVIIGIAVFLITREDNTELKTVQDVVNLIESKKM